MTIKQKLYNIGKKIYDNAGKIATTAAVITYFALATKVNAKPLPIRKYLQKNSNRTKIEQLAYKLTNSKEFDHLMPMYSRLYISPDGKFITHEKVFYEDSTDFVYVFQETRNKGSKKTDKTQFKILHNKDLSKENFQYMAREENRLVSLVDSFPLGIDFNTNDRFKDFKNKITYHSGNKPHSVNFEEKLELKLISALNKMYKELKKEAAKAKSDKKRLEKFLANADKRREEKRLETEKKSLDLFNPKRVRK